MILSHYFNSPAKNVISALQSGGSKLAGILAALEKIIKLKCFNIKNNKIIKNKLKWQI